jgi:hypothetical protein
MCFYSDDFGGRHDVVKYKGNEELLFGKLVEKYDLEPANTNCCLSVVLLLRGGPIRSPPRCLDYERILAVARL